MQFDYYGTWEDSWRILEALFIVRPDLKAYWDAGPREEPFATPFSYFTPTIRTQLKQRPGLYIFGNFSTSPPLFWQQDQGVNAGKFFLSDSGGGPLVSFEVARENWAEGHLILIRGGPWTQSKYLLDGSWEKPGAALKQAFVEITKCMKQHLVRHEGRWIAQEALALRQAGRAIFSSELPARTCDTSPTLASFSR